MAIPGFSPHKGRAESCTSTQEFVWLVIANDQRDTGVSSRSSTSCWLLLLQNQVHSHPRLVLHQNSQGLVSTTRGMRQTAGSYIAKGDCADSAREGLILNHRLHKRPRVSFLQGAIMASLFVALRSSLIFRLLFLQYVWIISMADSLIPQRLRR